MVVEISECTLRSKKKQIISGLFIIQKVYHKYLTTDNEKAVFLCSRKMPNLINFPILFYRMQN